MTDIRVLDRRGKIVFHSVEPHKMSDKEIERCLKAWRVDTTNKDVIVEVTYNE